MCGVSGSSLSYASRSSKTRWGWFLTHRQSHTRTHARTHTHTHSRAYASSWIAGVCPAEGVVGSRQSGGGVGRHGEHPGPARSGRVAWRNPPAPRAAGAPLEPHNSRARPNTSAVPASFCSQRGLPFPVCLARNPCFTRLGRPPASPRRGARRHASGRRASRELPRCPHPPRRPGGLAAARRRLPLLLPRRQEPLPGSRAALMYYSLGWPRRFLESPRRRREVCARQLLVRRSQFLGNWG